MEKVTNYYSYFEELASKHKLIAHTPDKPKIARLEYDDMGIKLVKTISAKTPVVGIGMPEQKINDKFSDNPHLITRIHLAVFASVGKDDFPKITQTIELCQDIGFDFMAAIFKDKTSSPPRIQSFDRNSIGITELHRFLDTQNYGVLFEFSLGRSIANELKYNPTKWL